MVTRVSVVEEAGVFVLRTAAGNLVGPRMWSQDPEKGRPMPSTQARYTTRSEADRAAIAWNVYLAGIKKRK
jgi:hypothetical protein